MGDVSLNQPINVQRPPRSIAKSDQIRDLISVGWTNESHSMYISSMEASFMQQLHRHERQAPDTNMSHMGRNVFKVIQGGALDNLRPEKNDVRFRDVAMSFLPENPWIRRFKPHNSGANRHSVGAGAWAVDDGESGTDTVQERVQIHRRELKSCIRENLSDKSTEVSGQNFTDVVSISNAVPSKSCKKRRSASTAAGCSILKLAYSDKRW